MDHILVRLRDEGPRAHRDLITLLQEVHPGWTTEFAPNAIMSWLRALDVIVVDGTSKNTDLTARGREWAAKVSWTPERLLPEADISEEEEQPVVTAVVADSDIEVPELGAILERLPKGFAFAKDQVAALHAGLWAHRRRHFAIFTGLSGSGKTSLARAYARAVIDLTPSTVDSKLRLRTVPVQPGWTDPTPLLGYVNPLKSAEYISTPFLKLLLSCATHPTKVHFAVLDEMNLSHPEQYLAPILSGMELENEAIVFHDEEVALDGIPARLERYPPNLVLIGTVNMDETTHGLSDKVLDRAVTLEFWDINLGDYPRWGTRGLPTEVELRVKEVLGALLAVLAPVRLHFGWRVVDDVLDFLRRSVSDGYLDADSALDWIVYSKVVPKLRGHDSKEYRAAFEACRAELKKYGLTRAQAKVAELARDLESTGSARFWR